MHHNIQSEAGKYVAVGIGLLASGVMLIGTGYMNFQFAYKLGRTPADGLMFGAIGIAIDVFLAASPFYFFSAKANKEWFGTIVALLCWIALAGVSANAAIGHIAGSRLELMSNRVAATTVYQDDRNELKRMEDRLAWLPKPVDSESSLRAKIKQQQGQLLFSQTAECANQWNTTTKNFCAEYTKLTSALGNVLEYDKTVADIRNLREKIGKQVDNHVGVIGDTSDAQAGLYAKALGVDPTTVSGLISLSVALVLLMVSSLGFYIAMAPLRSSKPVAAKEPEAKKEPFSMVPSPTPEPPPQPLHEFPPDMIDITPPQKPQLPPPPPLPVLSEDALALLKAIDFPLQPFPETRVRDPRDLVSWRFLAWMTAMGNTGFIEQDKVDAFYNEFCIADQREAWAMRIVKADLKAIKPQYVWSETQTMENNRRVTMWVFRPPNCAKLLEIMTKRGVLPGMEPESAPTIELPSKNVVYPTFKAKEAGA